MAQVDIAASSGEGPTSMAAHDHARLESSGGSNALSSLIDDAEIALRRGWFGNLQAAPDHNVRGISRCTKEVGGLSVIVASAAADGASLHVGSRTTRLEND